MCAAGVLPEKEVTALWLRLLDKTRFLQDLQGNPLEVVYAGRADCGRGGDFQDALVRFGSEYRSGAIEVHSLSSGWRTHGHHRDPAYNRIILQVVYRADSPRPALCQNGSAVPTVELENCRMETAAGSPGLGFDCGRSLPFAVLQQRVVQAGLLRLADKAESFSSALHRREPEQLVYQSVAEALGYAANRRPLYNLAEQCPAVLMAARASALESPQRERWLQAVLLGRAGLLPSQRSFSADGFAGQLEELWRCCPERFLAPVEGWQSYRVRPANHPVRRIAALGRLLAALLPGSWMGGLVEPLFRLSVSEYSTYLKSVLALSRADYWSEHYDFARPLYPGGALLGSERIAALALDVILPLASATGRSPAQQEAGRQVALQWPSGGSNSITRHLCRQTGWPPSESVSACAAQGLLYIYKRFCTQGRCAECPLI
jgi:hypothetical protein